MQWICLLSTFYLRLTWGDDVPETKVFEMYYNERDGYYSVTYRQVNSNAWVSDKDTHGWDLVHRLERLKRDVMESLRTPPQPPPEPVLKKCSLCGEYHRPETICFNSQERQDRLIAERTPVRYATKPELEAEGL